jgi:8-amino-7-oxononanoate synthase
MNASPIYDRINKELTERKSHNLFRQIPAVTPADGVIDCSTNSYLSLQFKPEIQQEAQRLSGGVQSGNLASRIVAQYSPLFDTLEAEIASWKHTETALVFNSGYATNCGIIQGLCTRDTEVFSDRLNHASIYDGIKLAGCKLTRYKHNDMRDLEVKCSSSSSREKIIITDSVFSMDGDCAPLADIVTIAKKYNCMTMIDEAHAAGILGPHCGGLADKLGISLEIDIVMGTLSKALAGCGGYVAVSSPLRDYFVNNCRSLIYSTALPHTVLAHNLAALRYVRSHTAMGSALFAMAEEFRWRVKSDYFSTGCSVTQIVPVITGDETRALALRSYLKKNGIIAPAIRPPTVPAGTSRIRISLHGGLSRTDLEKVITVLNGWNGSDE